MERKFFMNDCEESLKEYANQFKMIPSKRVWHGIYNDLHPGRRWPSITMSLLLIFALVFIGYLNTNNVSKSLNSTTNITESKNLKGKVKTTEISEKNQKIALSNSDPKHNNEVSATKVQLHNTGLPTITIENQYQSHNSITDSLVTDNSKTKNNSGSPDFEKNTILLPELNSNSGTGNIVRNMYDFDTRLQNNISLDGIVNKTIKEKIVVNYFDNFLPAKQVTIENKENLSNKELLMDKNIDKVVAGKKSSEAEKKIAKLHKKRNDKIAWVYFVAPVVSSVSFNGEPLKQSPNANFSLSVAVNQKENKVLHNLGLGLEAGAQMNYTLAKKLQLTTGAHLTYSGYNIISNEVHPTFATLVLKDPATGMVYAKSYITHFGDGTGQSAVSLRNYNWQASIPIGLQYEFLGNNKVQFNAGANLEPSLVIKSNAYILSSDGRNYVNDPALLRKWNVSSNFGAFVTFSSSKFRWHIGPNVRYQWLSTYQKDYTVKEHLIDYGIRIGISK